MKNFRNEKLSEHLLNVDDGILSNAYEIDSAEKLREYSKTKRAKSKKPVYKTPAFRIAVAVAACVALLVGMLLFRPKEVSPSVDAPPKEEKPPVENLLPWQKEEEAYISIDSIDMLNYYTAMKALADSAQVTNMDFREGTEGITLLSANIQGESKKYYYELDPNAKFSVSKVVFFQIRVKNEDGFLASKVGTGIVDVVITENSLEPMITFKNGDRYYSCCENATSRTGKTYSSHKYIEGFGIVKNLEQENYSFKIIYDNFNLDYEDVAAISVTCEPFGQHNGDAADGKLSVISETYVSDQRVELTLAELEEYCNADKEDGLSWVDIL